MILPLLAEAGLPMDLKIWAIGGIVVGAVAGAAVAANQIDDFLDRRKDKPQSPPNQQLEASLKNVAERIDRVEKDISGIQSELKEDRISHEKHISTRSKTIYDKIDSVSKELRAEMQEQTNRREEQTNKLGDRIEAMPEKLLNMLNTMGVLKK